MMLTRTVHPPAGSNAIIGFLAKPAAGSLLVSTFAGTVALVVMAHFYHRTTGRHAYPLLGRPLDQNGS
jgi:CBS-domain-containing membrane protein